MKMPNSLKTKIKSLNGNDKQNLTNFMELKGFNEKQWNNNSINNAIRDSLNEYFATNSNNNIKGDNEMDNLKGNQNSNLNDEVAGDTVVNDTNIVDGSNALANENGTIGDTPTDNNENNSEQQNNNNENNDDKDDEMVNQEMLDKAKKVKDEAKKQQSEKTRLKTEKDSAKKIYKIQDNLYRFAEVKHTELEDVKQLTENRFYAYITGGQLATLFMNGNLVFDETMQRGVKVDKNGNVRANFNDTHVKEIAEAISKEKFTPTQIVLGLVTDDESEDRLSFSYDEDENILRVDGIIRLIDGQHRTRACVKVLNEQKHDNLHANVDLNEVIFNVEIHVGNAEYMRTVYGNIDKNLKLDKSQKTALSDNASAKIVNFLNTSSESNLKDKIATTKTAGDKLVLFTTLTESIDKNAKIETVEDREAVKMYLKDFFNYLVQQNKEAFGSDIESRKKFREHNLLNENNFFRAWVALAFEDVDNYKENIDKVLANKDRFEKDFNSIDDKGEKQYLWLNYNAVKKRQAKKDKDGKEVPQDGFAMNNTSTAFTGMIKEVLNIIAKKEEGENNDNGNIEGGTEQ